VPAGSRDENTDNNGITHLIEHLIFKGTKKRSYKDIAVEFDAMGAEFNAFTDKEYCCIYSDFIDENLPECTELLLDIICSPSFLNEHIKTEKRVIFEEIKMMEDSPSEMLLNHFFSEVFNGHSLSMPIMGTKNILKKINRKDVSSYFSEKFDLNSMVISAAGNVKHDSLVRMVKEASEKSGYRRNNIETAEIKLHVKVDGSRKIHYGKSKAVHMCIGGRGCGRSDRDRYPLALFINILGGSMSSRLFQKIREEEGLAYSISANNINYSDTGLLFIYSASSAGNINKILMLINKEIEDIRGKGISSEELEIARENIKGNIVLGVEDISSRMFRLGKTLLFDKKVLTIDKILKKIDKIKVSDINSVVEKYFFPGNFSTVILGKNMKGLRK
jgi:predicted Zn-dependent peptidase